MGTNGGYGKGRPRLTPEQRQDILRRHDAGESAAAIAADYGITSAAVYYHLKTTMRHTPLRDRDERDQPADGRYLTDAQVHGILERRRGGDTLDAIADDLGVSRSTVQHHCAQAGLAGGGRHTRPLVVDEDLDWQADALCAQTDPEAFFPEKGGSTREAKSMCLRCDVRTQCLDYALTNNEAFGIYGGTTPRERRRLQKRGAV